MPVITTACRQEQNDLPIIGTVGRYRSHQRVGPWTAPSREAKIVLAGTVQVEINDGPTLELKAGDILSLPKGSTSTWSVSDDYQEFWILDDLGAGD